jgi:hypothetical protein
MPASSVCFSKTRSASSLCITHAQIENKVEIALPSPDGLVGLQGTFDLW